MKFESYDNLVKKWTPILEHADLPKIENAWKRKVTAVVLENQEQALKEEHLQSSFSNPLNEDAPVNNYGGGNIASWDPVLISLVRRSMPVNIAFDLCGVQPMTMPTGLIFALKSRYLNQTGTEALFNEADTGFSSSSRDTLSSPDASTQLGDDIPGNSVVSGNAGPSSGLPTNLADTSSPYTVDSSPVDYVADTMGARGGMTTAEAEALGDARDNDFQQMAFSIEKATVTALSRALKAEYTMELAQDLKAVHGLDAETELSNILSTEINAEITREIVRTVNVKAKLGAQQAELAFVSGYSTLGGVFDLKNDAQGRWSAENWRGLVYQIERECNQIARDTRRGKGNIILASSDVASGLAALGMLEYNPNLQTSLEVDDTANTYAGTLYGRIKVYIDPYSTDQYINVGYKGTSPYDAGLFYCPYVPLTMVRAVGEQSFQPKIGFKTRFGMIANPFAESTVTNGIGTNRSNVYYRIFKVINLAGAAA